MSLLAVAIYGLAGVFSSGFYRFLFNANYIQDQYQFGDLYKASNLAQFKGNVKDFECTKSTLKFDSSLKNYSLMVVGDSFLDSAKFINSNSWSSATYSFIHWNNVSKVIPSTKDHKTNVLIVEMVERNLRNNIFLMDKVFQKEITIAGENKPENNWLNFWNNNNTIKADPLLEQQLFNNNFWQTLKEWKAAFNYMFFNQVDSFVTQVNSNKSLVLSQEINELSNESCLNKLPEKEWQFIESQFIMLKEKAYNKGFNTVIFSIIPNKSTMLLDSKETNGLLEKLANSNSLKENYIDVYTEFRKNPIDNYQLGDTHWSCTGRDIWLQKVKQKLINNPAK